ncbi:hypothetical protein GCM10009859_01140 [Kocuria salsicia]
MVSNRIQMIRGLRRSPETLASHPTPSEPNASMSDPRVPISTVRVSEDALVSSGARQLGSWWPGAGATGCPAFLDVVRTARASRWSLRR